MTMIHGLLVLLLAAAQPQPQPETPPQPNPASVAGFAAFLQQDLPQRFRGYRMVGARAEGDVLVITLDGRRGWRRPATNAERATAILGTFCGEFRELVNMSGVRVDTLENGGDLVEGTTVTECPAADNSTASAK